MTDRTSQKTSSNHGPTIVLIAGEASGDQLGGELVRALRQRYPDAQIVGVGGPHMQEADFEAWHDIHELSVMGFLEVLKHLPRLLKLRRSLTERIIALRPDLVIGIDAPDFNLGLERAVKKAGIRSVHYVSPSVWAWREKRAEKIGRSADRVLCLFPMEPAIYARHGIDARFVGHPLADRFPMSTDRAAAREELGLDHDHPVLAVLPGSRGSEVERLGEVFLDAARQVAEALPGLQVVVPVANARCRDILQGMVSGPGTRDPGPDFDASHGQLAPPEGPSPDASRNPHAPDSPSKTAGPGSRGPGPVLLNGHAHAAMLAADVVLLASGTATLEAMLAKRPMVVGYRVAPLTYRFVRALKLIKTDTFAMPNILAGRKLVPELMQDDCTRESAAAAVLDLFRDQARRAAIVTEFERLHRELRGELSGNAADHAVDAIADLLPASD